MHNGLDKMCDRIMLAYREGYGKAIDEFAEIAMEQFTDFDLKHGYPTIADCKVILREVAEQLRAGGK